MIYEEELESESQFTDEEEVTENEKFLA